MKRVRIVALVAATLGVAVGAGTLFQQDAMRQAEQARATPGSAQPAQAETSLVALAGTGGAQVTTASALPGMVSTAEPLVEQDREVEALVADAPLARALTENDAVAPVVTPAQAPETDVATTIADPALIEDLLAEVDACAVWLVVTPEAGAMLDMSLFAPCDGDAVVRISHAGLRFDARIGGDGRLALVVPALEPEAELTVTFIDGRTAADATEVADVVLYDRLAIQWEGPAVLGLNAYEFGADYGGANHIHPGNPATPGDIARGFLTVLGEPALDAPALVQVYSFPTGLSARMGQVELELEAAITEASCERMLDIDTLEALAGSAPVWRAIRLEMPACDGQGGFLVLKNLLPELTIALN